MTQFQSTLPSPLQSKSISIAIVWRSSWDGVSCKWGGWRQKSHLGQKIKRGHSPWIVADGRKVRIWCCDKRSEAIKNDFVLDDEQNFRLLNKAFHLYSTKDFWCIFYTSIRWGLGILQRGQLLRIWRRHLLLFLSSRCGKTVDVFLYIYCVPCGQPDDIHKTCGSNQVGRPTGLRPLFTSTSVPTSFRLRLWHSATSSFFHVNRRYKNEKVIPSIFRFTSFVIIEIKFVFIRSLTRKIGQGGDAKRN